MSCCAIAQISLQQRSRRRLRHRAQASDTIATREREELHVKRVNELVVLGWHAVRTNTVINDRPSEKRI